MIQISIHTGGQDFMINTIGYVRSAGRTMCGPRIFRALDSPEG